MQRQAFINPRPYLLVESLRSAGLGNCYSSSTRRVTSTMPLDLASLQAIRGAGALVMGQEFYCHQIVDGKRVGVPAKITWQDKVEPSGLDEVPCSVLDIYGRPIPGEVAVNYRSEPIPPTKLPYYTYECESRVDSSD